MSTATMPLPQLVTLCGSMRFFDRMLAVAAAKTAAGAIVLAPFCVVDPVDQTGDLKERLDQLHRHKIDLADEVVIVTDEAGYLGDSTRAEIRYAEALGKPIRYTADAK